MAELLDLKQRIEDERKLCKIDMQSPVIHHKRLMALVLQYLNQVLGEYEVSTNVEGEHLQSLVDMLSSIPSTNSQMICEVVAQQLLKTLHRINVSPQAVISANQSSEFFLT